MKYYLIAGEASGDMHGARLISQITQHDPNAEFRLWGGEKMSTAANTTVVKHYKDYDHMGIAEVLKHARKILRNIAFCKQDLVDNKPDAIIFIDFPGFNLKIAPFAKSLGIKTFFYISPTIWAWKEGRVKKIKKYIDHMFVELPFIKDVYAKHNYKVDFVGHPLLDSIHDFTERETYESFISKNSLPEKKIIAVLPGSREYEIRENLRTMQEISEDFHNYEFVIAGMSRFTKAFYEKFITAHNVSIVFDQTYELLTKSEAAIVVSGTATLETALFNIPEVIVFQTSPFTFYLAKSFVKLSFLGLPNIIMNRAIVPELLQKDMNAKNLHSALTKILFDTSYKNEIAQSYAKLQEKLGNDGTAHRTAQLIHRYLTE
ncbi:MAG: lipid-A-disaccharide synthase [Bacteroidales bacterium]|jgi:lipid-A-disaccharide synthase|nr:lipid-A-disaccharide synthase [Bacteroidales bacterium]